MEITKVTEFDFDHDEIEQRKQLVRDLWTGRPLDHIPIHMVVSDPQPRYTVREHDWLPR
jgi:hypothetical protein